MRQFSLTWIFAAALVSGIVHAQTSEQALQESFLEGARFLQAGEYERAAGVFKELLKKTDSPRVKLELARALYHLGQYDEAKVLFEEVSGDRGTPWRVRDNIEHYIREIEARTGYWKMGVSLVSDSNPRNLTSQREFSIGGAQVTYSPSEQPRRVTGLRYTARGMIPVAEPFQAAAYLTASYVNYPKDDLDRLTLDFGLARSVTDSGRVRGKAGIESGTLAGTRLYSFPYIGVSSALAISETFRLDGELKAGRVEFPDYRFLDATYTSAALTARRPVSQAASLSLAGQIESSRARERPYSYYGLEISPGISTFWAESAFQVGATAALGYRKYADADPFFGQRRTDSKRRLEITVGNKQWRWMNRNAGLVLAVERGRSDIDFYSYKKANFSIVIE